MEKTNSNPIGNKTYRVVRYFDQWPQGHDFEVLKKGLTQEEAEKVLAQESANDPSEDLVVEAEEKS